MNITELTLAMPDPVAARAFYCDLLGFAEEHVEAGLALRVGSTRLLLQAAAVGEQPRYHVAFAVPIAQFEALRAAVGAQLPLIDDRGEVMIVSESWNTVGFYFRDPAGNILECIARTRGFSIQDSGFRSSDDGSFSVRSSKEVADAVLSICEIGLVTDDVPATAADLRAALGIETYRGAAGDEFTALGDDDGLLIVVKRGRIWYPDTGVAAAPAPTRLTLNVDGEDFALSGPPLNRSQGSGFRIQKR
jgi:catechol-2,3-dioxygenase